MHGAFPRGISTEDQVQGDGDNRPILKQNWARRKAVKGRGVHQWLLVRIEHRRSKPLEGICMPGRQVKHYLYV